MTVKSIEGGYLVDCRPCGRRGKRYRKKFKTKGEAQTFERWLIASKNDKDWIDKPKDRRKLNDLIELWFKYKGKKLKSGEGNYQKLLHLSRDLGNPRACDLSKRMFIDYRVEQFDKGIKASTLNRTQMLLSGVFTTLIEIDEFFAEHPTKGLSKLKIPPSEMSFLSQSEIKILLSTLQADNLKIAKLCLSTGARWGEAANLKGRNIQGNKVTFVDTKNGKNRTVPVRPDLIAEIDNGKSGTLFRPCYVEFRKILCGLDFDLPRGQATHVLRHTFASHFMMNGGNILTLQKILGHATIMQTMTYAHLAPDYLNEAMKLNPLEPNI
ncbi:tyrosine-type recombinase/integrase [Vibrio scophthalmi]|uniref:Integrase n=1 Tax=Vibrio scophthalmi TaxID=45658 RepID=A0A1E3WFZ0_9VIBR|nr:tyrosine-type recombinase/integrase [Vibrio scophthalmi]ODS04721.1 Integrase [Vibrio scophthalmi]ODS04729.1 Integrase [Vibrio scophthalmi]